jgi:hypothetical protein
MVSAEGPAISATAPAMSVIVATERYETVRALVRCLRAQTVRDQLEVVIAAPSAEILGIDRADLEGFCRVHVVEVGAFEIMARPRAAAVRQATAPIAVFTESHAFPVPEWAEALIAAHRQPWAAVGPSLRNANPAGLISWANLFLDYGPWVEHAGGEVADVPGHNSAYKRELLLSFGPELESMIRIEAVLHAALRERGHRFYLAPQAAIYHVNVSRPADWLGERWHAARVFAAERSRTWSWPRRLLFAGGSPLIPLIRTRRTLQQIRAAGLQLRLLPRVLPFLVLSLIVNAVGEMIGYAAGAGGSWRVVCHHELYKLGYASAREREAILRDPAPLRSAGPAAEPVRVQVGGAGR